MMGIGTVRRVGRILLIVIFCLIMFAVGVVIRIVTLPRPEKRYKLLYPATSFWGYGMAWIMGMRIKVEGPRPRTPFFLVSNHISYMDILLVCAVCPAWFISKSEVASWPGIGPLTRMGPTIFIDREIRRDVKRMNHLIADLVLDGGAVGFFPEGTTTHGEELLPFKPSLFQPAVEMNLPVTTAAIAYETRPGMAPPSELIAWYGDADFAPHVGHLLKQPGFSVAIRFGEQAITAGDRKELAQRSHAQIKQDLIRLKG
ncbi:lysophospholipid acyltransferase family protein [Kiritimatiellaeota bacterium B1221]|nr:lysophospholipid acyltransferase family protein [Kiritimatiellaeota bacterium B1221]